MCDTLRDQRRLVITADGERHQWEILCNVHDDQAGLQNHQMALSSAMRPSPGSAPGSAPGQLCQLFQTVHESFREHGATPRQYMSFLKVYASIYSSKQSQLVTRKQHLQVQQSGPHTLPKELEHRWTLSIYGMCSESYAAWCLRRGKGSIGYVGFKV